MQTERENSTCRLCLASCDCSFENVDEVAVQMLTTLGLEFDFSASDKPVTCRTCSEGIQKYFDFKTICGSTEDCIDCFKGERSEVKLDLTGIYLKVNGNENITLSSSHTICRLCMEITESNCSISLNSETKDGMSAETILGTCFSELDLDVTKNPVICTFCNETLHNYFDFVKNCLNVKGKTKMYCEMNGRDSERQVESNGGLQVGEENVSNSKNDRTGVDIHKNCNKNELYDEIEFKIENMGQKECQQWQIKYEVNEQEEIDDVKEETQECNHNQPNGEGELKCKNPVENGSPVFDVKHDEIDIKQEDEATDRLQNNTPTDVSETVQAYSKSCLETRVLPTHKNDSETYQCDLCSFETRHKGVLKRHTLIHRISSGVITYTCGICTCKVKLKGGLKQHMLIHKNTSEGTVHSCEICTYKSKDKDSLDHHMMIHRNASDVTMYSCEICTYKAKQIGNLKRHMLIHRNASEVTMYSCEICTYKVKHKAYLKHHMLIHKKASEVTMHSCEICTYKTKHKGSLKSHMMIHKNTSEVTMHSCEICTYKTKRKGCLRQHMRIHRDASEVTMYSCEICTYKARRKDCLKHHMLIHKNNSEVTIYSCGICTYKTKLKGGLKQHMVVHKNASELTMYSCEICAYKAKRKSNLERHMLMHKEASEITMYSCEVCTYKAKQKHHLKRHMLIHKMPRK